jgi:hypothetical protein
LKDFDFRLPTDEGAKSPIGNQASALLPVAATTATAASTTAAGISAATARAATASRTTIATAASEVIAWRTRFIHCQSAALQRLSIEAGDGPFHVLALSQFDETEAPRLPCHFIANDHGGSCLKTCATDELTQFTVSNFVGQVPYK